MASDSRFNLFDYMGFAIVIVILFAPLFLFGDITFDNQWKIKQLEKQIDVLQDELDEKCPTCKCVSSYPSFIFLVGTIIIYVIMLKRMNKFGKKSKEKDKNEEAPKTDKAN